MSLEAKDLFLLEVGAFLGWAITWCAEQFKKKLAASYFLESNDGNIAEGWLYFEYVDGWNRASYTKRPINGTESEKLVSQSEFQKVRLKLQRRGIP